MRTRNFNPQAFATNFRDPGQFQSGDSLEDELASENSSITESSVVSKLLQTFVGELAPGGVEGVIKGLDTSGGKQMMGTVGKVLIQKGNDFGLNPTLASILGKALLAVSGVTATDLALQDDDDYEKEDSSRSIGDQLEEGDPQRRTVRSLTEDL